MDLSLLLPEWQGYGLDGSVGDGARALASTFPAGSLVEIVVPATEQLTVEHAVLGLQSITALTRRVLDTLTNGPTRIFNIAHVRRWLARWYLNARYRGDLEVVWPMRMRT